MLPKVDYPITTILVPSLSKKIRFRPYLVKEEKLLLMAKESGSPADILTATKQIVNNCVLDPQIDVNTFTIFDLEYIFLKLTAISVDNIVKLSYRDLEDDQDYNFAVDLNQIEVTYPPTVSNVIKISDAVSLVMRYPSAALYDDTEYLSLEDDQLFGLIVRCIKQIADGDQVFEASSHTIAELSEFVDNLSGKTFTEIQEFLASVPSISHTIEYTNKMGNKRTIVLSSLSDFFPWR